MWLSKFRTSIFILMSYILVNCKFVENNDVKNALFGQTNRKVSELMKQKKLIGIEYFLTIPWIGAILVLKKEEKTRKFTESRIDVIPNVLRKQCPKANVHNCFHAAYTIYFEACKSHVTCGPIFRKVIQQHMKKACMKLFPKDPNPDRLNGKPHTCALSALRTLQEDRFRDDVKADHTDAGFHNKLQVKALHQSNLRKDVSLDDFKAILRRDYCEAFFRKKCKKALTYALKEASYKYEFSKELINHFYRVGSKKCSYSYRFGTDHIL